VAGDVSFMVCWSGFIFMPSANKVDLKMTANGWKLETSQHLINRSTARNIRIYNFGLWSALS